MCMHVFLWTDQVSVIVQENGWKFSCTYNWRFEYSFIINNVKLKKSQHTYQTNKDKLRQIERSFELRPSFQAGEHSKWIKQDQNTTLTH